MKEKIKHVGGCHCGSVFYEVMAPKELEVMLCNCSICTKSGFVHLIVPASDFNFVRGQEFLTVYKFNTKTAEHYFCVQCGIKSFYKPRSHPDCVSVNVNCLESQQHVISKQTSFDGKNWESAILSST